MRIATWNVNGLRARLDFVLHWLRERRPDVAGLQELKLADAQFPHAAVEAAGYRAVVHGQKGWNGVAVLGRGELAGVEAGLPGQEGLGARLLAVRTGALTVITVYCPNGKSVGHADFAGKLGWLDALRGLLERRHDPAQPLVLCGDFNLCPAPLDSWDEEGRRGTIFHTAEERARFRGLLDWGLVDVFRAQHPDLAAFSWWDYRGGAFHRGQGLRIDLVLATPVAAARVRAAAIDRDYRKKKEGLTPSDHAPVLVDLE